MNKKTLLLSLLISLSIFFSYCHFTLLNLDALQINEAKKTLTNTQINKILSKSSDSLYLNFITVSLSILIRVVLVSFVLSIGSFLFNFKLLFKRIFSIVIVADYIFLLPILFEIVFFKFINTKATIDDIEYFYPLSALNIVGYKGLEAWYIYPFQVLNLFEVAYIFILAYYIGKLTQTNTDRGLTIVSASYVPALVLWVVCVMFFTLSYS